MRDTVLLLRQANTLKLSIVIVRLDRTIQNLVFSIGLDSPIESGNDKYESFKCLFAGLLMLQGVSLALSDREG